MRNISELTLSVVVYFAVFFSLSCFAAIDEARAVSARAVLEPIHEIPEAKPPPDVVPIIEDPEPKPQSDDPALRQKPGSSGTRTSIRQLLKDKLLYPIEGLLRINTRPRNGNSAIVINRGNGKVELVLGYKDMLSVWEAGRGLLADPSKGTVTDPRQDIVVDFPITPDLERFSERTEALKLLNAKEANPWGLSVPIDPFVARARAKEGIKYYKYLEQATQQAKEEGRDMSLVRLGMSKSEAKKYRPYSLPILAPVKPNPSPDNRIRPGDPRWKQSMFSNRGYDPDVDYVPARVDNYKELKVSDPSIDPYILILDEYNIIDWNPPERPANYRPAPVAPDVLPPPKRALRRGLITPPSLHKRQVNLGTLFEQSSNSSDAENTLANEAAQFKQFYEAFQAVQYNISTLIFPFLETMVNNSNASIVYHAAWSIWAELTMADDIVAGPFCSGLNRIAEIEDAYARANNLFTTSEAYKHMLVLDGILIAKYEIAWNQSLQAVNASGLLDLRDALAENLQVNGTGIESADFNALNTDVSGIEWFVQYDVPTNATLNSTSAR